MGEENDLDFSIENPRQHLCLTIFDVIGFLKDVKLNNLKDEVTYAILVNYNKHLDVAYHIDVEMDAQAIRRRFNDLPNDLKEKMTKKVIIYDMDAKYFIEEIFNFIDVQQRHYIKDIGMNGGILNTISIASIIVVITMYIIYRTNHSYRGTGIETVGDGIIKSLIDYGLGLIQ